MSLPLSRAASLTGGGTVYGNLHIEGNLTVDGETIFDFDEVGNHNLILDTTNTEAFLVRIDGDGGDIFIVDTDTPGVTINAALAANGDITLTDASPLFTFSDSTSPGVDDGVIAQFDFVGLDDAGTPAEETYGKIEVLTIDATAASNAGQMRFKIIQNNTLRNYLDMIAGDGADDGLIEFNADQQDIDFEINALGISVFTINGSTSSIAGTTNKGTGETIVFTNTQGTNAAAIALTATAGGIVLTTGATAITIENDADVVFGQDVYIRDDKKLYFGSTPGFSMKYGEDGNDNMSFDRADINMNGYSLLNAQLELSLAQGLSWDQTAAEDVAYERLGSIAGRTASVSAGNAYLPIQSDMKRCLLEDAGTIAYYIDADDPIMKDGTTVAVSGAATSQPEFFTTEEDRTLELGTSDWTNAAAGDAYASFDKTGDLSLTADAIGDYCYITFTSIGTVLENGKRYVLEYDYTETVAGFEFKLKGVTGQTIGDAVAGTDKKIYFTAVEDYAATDQLQIMAKTAANAQGDFDNFSLKCCQLVDAAGDFVTDGVVAGMYIRNTTDSPDSYAYIMQVEATKLTLNTDIFPDGTDAYEVGTADFSGTDGQVMVEIPKFYYKQYKTGDIFYWYISKYDLAGFELHPAFWKDGQEVDYRYYSAFEGSMWDATFSAMTAKASIPTSLYAAGDKMCSVAGQWAKTNETRTEYRAMALARGTGFRQLDYYLHSAVQLLYLIEYADFNSQDMIGMGRTELSGGTWTADSYIGLTGLGVPDGDGTNSVSNGTTIGYLTDYMTYRGIENIFGNVWKILDGITWDGSWIGSAAAQPVYVTNNSSYFQDAARVNMQFLCNASYIGTFAGYIGNLENVTGFIPSNGGGSETTKVCDYYSQYSEVGRDCWRLVMVGDNAERLGRGGVYALHVFSSFGSYCAYYCGRLAY